jgi:hypothetical protein
MFKHSEYRIDRGAENKEKRVSGKGDEHKIKRTAE